MQRSSAALLLAVALAAAGPHKAHGQLSSTDAECQAELVQASAGFNSACCPANDPSACANGTPNACPTACAQAFMPFYSHCQSFVASSLPELVSFGAQCTAAGVTAGPAPPASSVTAGYVQATLAITLSRPLATSKKQNRFKSEIRSDFAEALGLAQRDVLVTAMTANSITIDVFTTTAGEAASVQSNLVSQLGNAHSALLTGFVSDSINPGQGAGQVQVMSVGSAGGAAGSTTGHFHVTADNGFEAYVNGEEVGTGDDWTVTYDLPFDAPCGSGNAVYAVHANDAGGPAALIGSITHCGGTSVTRLAWRCTDDPALATDGWNNVNFDESLWPVAISGGTNGAPPWGVRPDIGTNAHWIWASSFTSTDEVWCRCTSGGHAYDDGLYGDGASDGQVHIGADDTVTVYINGNNIGQTTVDQWDQTERFAIPGGMATCDIPTVYALETTDASGVAGVIATINHCGESINTLPARWKCSDVCEDGWEAVDFDDSNWNIAVDAGVNGSPPWSRHEVDANAHWIWTSPTEVNGATGIGGDDQGFEHDSRRSCCRYKSQHNAINCDAARRKYTSDYLVINECQTDGCETGNCGPNYCHMATVGQNHNGGAATTGSAFNHFHSTGMAAGYIWHSELCNPDGSDISLTQDCSIRANEDGSFGSGVAECGEVHGQAHIDADDGYHLYVNGDEVGHGEDYTQVDGYSFNAGCDSPTTYAIEAYDTGGQGSVIADFVHCGETIRTSTAWKCHQFGDAGAPDGWKTADFDDSAWPDAGDVGDNGVEPWGHRVDISGEAHWIWTQDSRGHDQIYCRYVSQHHHLDCPAAQARYWTDYPDVAAYMADGEAGPGMEAWDHYEHYGEHEGRIWHSNLCNEDNTNKNSYCEHKQTSDQFEYDFLTEALGPEKAITFSVRAANDAHIGFFEERDDGETGHNYGDGAVTSGFGAQYEVVLCGWSGQQSVIREGNEDGNVASIGSFGRAEQTPGWIDSVDYRQFWATAANGLVRVGTGNIVGFHTFMTWQDPDVVLDIKYAAVSTGWGADGDWVVCIPERCSGWFDAVDAALVGAEVLDCSSRICNPVDCPQGCPANAGTADGAGYAGGAGFEGMGFVNPTNAAGDTITFTLSGCKAGAFDLGFQYALASGSRSMGLSVNGIDQTAVRFPATGGWLADDWREIFTTVQLTTGRNLVTLSTTGDEGPNLDSLEVTAKNNRVNTYGGHASRHGVAKITADNGYSLFVNGDLVGSGGAILPTTDPNYEANGWVRTDTYQFIAPCEMPTSYAIEAVDSEGIAAVIASIDHCGKTANTGSDWRCAASTTSTVMDSGGSTLGNTGNGKRHFVVIDTRMTFGDAQTYCRQHHDDLASIHSAEQNLLVKQKCQAEMNELREWAYVHKGASIIGTSSNIAFDGAHCGSNAGDYCATLDPPTCGTDPTGQDCSTARYNDENLIIDTTGECDAQNCGVLRHAANGDSRFMFGYNDQNQQISVDLGVERKVKKLGAEISLGDRDVSSFSVEIATEQGPPNADGSPGTPLWTAFGDPVTVDTSDAAAGIEERWVELDTAIQVRYVKFSFGAASSDWGGVGSSLTKLHAMGPFEDGDEPPQSCWIGLNDVEVEGRLVWSDATSVDYYNFNPNEPNNYNNGVEDEDCVNLDVGARDGHWNDLSCNTGESAQGGNGLLFPVCQTTVYHPRETHTYIGCFVDGGGDGSIGRDVNGIAGDQTGQGSFFDMGVEAGAAECAELCAGFRFFATQHYSQCFCDNANIQGASAPDSECNEPCNQGTDNDGTVDHYGTQLHSTTEMCGGSWRNSVYSTSTTYWESAGYDDRAWEMANDLGGNGVAPWYHRPGLPAKADWIWTAGANDHDHVFCRFVQPNGETNCPAAQAMYLQDHPDVYAQGFPAWQHFFDVGEELGYNWHSELCNYCHPGDNSGEIASMAGAQTTNTPGAGGSYGTPYSFETGTICTDKCTGKHDAASGILGVNDGTGEQHPGVTLVGAVACGGSNSPCHGGHYGQGFADFQNPTGDSITFHLYACNAGLHEMSIIYALASDDPPRPLSVTVNGQISQQGMDGSSVNFPATGAWTEWGRVYVPVLLHSGANEITLSAIANSGPNIDSIEIFPQHSIETGHAFIEVDNEYDFYVNDQRIGSGTQWDQSDTWTFTAPCTGKTVYSIHGHDLEVGTGVAKAGIIGTIEHCGEVIRTDKRWKCQAEDMTHGTGVGNMVDQWNNIAFDDSSWNHATEYGQNSDAGNYWYSHMNRPVDRVSEDARWIWTEDATTHDSVFCRYISDHKPIDCGAAARRYREDYPEATMNAATADNMNAWDSFQNRGKWQGKLWHSELCSTKCQAHTAAFSWVDAAANGEAGPALNDDDLYEMDLPFPFEFYNQMKTKLKISSNGYVTFSGEHLGYGGTFHIPHTAAPNDMIAAYWTDFDPTVSGTVHTMHSTNADACPNGIASGEICCASTCGTCGGSGCQMRGGGSGMCCAGRVRSAGVKCSENHNIAPCIIDGEAFTIEWNNMATFGAPAGAATSTFEVTLFSSGEIKMQYMAVPWNTYSNGFSGQWMANSGSAGNTNAQDKYDKPTIGIENGAGNGGIQIERGGPPTRPMSAYVIGHACGTTTEALSVGYCPNANDPALAQYNGICDNAYADAFCQDTYGGQLASPDNQPEYDTMNALLNGATHPWMIGLTSDGAGHWSWTNGDGVDEDFLRAHSADQLQGTAETQAVFYPPSSTGGTSGFHDWNQVRTGQGNYEPGTAYNPGSATGSDWVLEGFVCEFYAAPGTLAIGLNRAFDDADQFCQDRYGWNQPLMIGLKSDGAGNWAWVDGSPVDMDLLIAHSFDGLQGTDETVAVIYPPICQEGWSNGVHQPNAGGDDDTCVGDAADPAHGDHGLHDWGLFTEPKAFVCDSNGQVSLLSQAPPDPLPAVGGGH